MFATIFFEVSIHALKHAYHHNEIVSDIIHKVNAELTVLGFISILTILIVQNSGGNARLTESLGEFEIAHVWLFFVGLMFVLEAMLMIYYAYVQLDLLSTYEGKDNK